MLTLVACLILVAVSAAAVLHITLDDGLQRATQSPGRSGVGRSTPPSDRARGAAAERPGPPRDGADGAVEPTPAPAESAGERPGKGSRQWARTHRLRSATLLVALLVTVGGVLALVVAVTLGLLVVALRGAVG